jgi:glycosyltransferase involved in cell wall biosynthesis
MRIVFFMTNDPVSYSGGRYHAMLMAEALAAAGHQVTICTNNVPVFFDELQTLPKHDSLRIMLSRHLERMPRGKVDLIIVVPQSGPVPWLYSRALLLARTRGARVALLNFESPNWFNAYSPEPRNVNLWKGWVEVSRSADMILSLVAEGTKYAKEFYDEIPGHTLFRHCYPPVNSIMADSVGRPPKRKQILCITRAGATDAHKGGHELLKALCPALKGYTLLLLVGSGEIDSALHGQLTRRAEKYGASVEIAYRLTDREKFRRIKESAMMLFLSRFEGFGYPPVEAQYCDVPCVVYDLPVLREVSGDGLVYVPPGDGEALRSAITRLLAAEPRPDTHLSEQIEPRVSFDTRCAALDGLMEEVGGLESPPAVNSAPLTMVRQWKRSLTAWWVLRSMKRAGYRAKRLARRVTLWGMVLLARPVRRVAPGFVELVKSYILKEDSADKPNTPQHLSQRIKSAHQLPRQPVNSGSFMPGQRESSAKENHCESTRNDTCPNG